MIPQIVPPLTGLGVLVTRPVQQAQSLIDAIARLGGEPLALPTIEIVPVVTAEVRQVYDLVVFTSVNAVQHCPALVLEATQTRIAAIGPATAAALRTRNLSADIVPTGSDSESLLGHPDLDLRTGQRALIVRGVGGRELLRESLHARGVTVDVVEAYERALPRYSAAEIEGIEARWQDGEIDVVTVTSADALTNLRALLTAGGQQHLLRTLVLVPSVRVREFAHSQGLAQEFLVAPGADNAAILGTLTGWHARSRTYATR